MNEISCKSTKIAQYLHKETCIFTRIKRRGGRGAIFLSRTVYCVCLCVCVRCGGSVKQRNARGETAYEMANRLGQKEIADRLVARLAADQLDRLARPAAPADPTQTWTHTLFSNACYSLMNMSPHFLLFDWASHLMRIMLTQVFDLTVTFTIALNLNSLSALIFLAYPLLLLWLSECSIAEKTLDRYLVLKISGQII